MLLPDSSVLLKCHMNQQCRRWIPATPLAKVLASVAIHVSWTTPYPESDTVFPLLLMTKTVHRHGCVKERYSQWIIPCTVIILMNEWTEQQSLVTEYIFRKEIERETGTTDRSYVCTTQRERGWTLYGFEKGRIDAEQTWLWQKWQLYRQWHFRWWWWVHRLSDPILAAYCFDPPHPAQRPQPPPEVPLLYHLLELASDTFHAVQIHVRNPVKFQTIVRSPHFPH